MHNFLVLWFGWVHQMGCLGVVLLMAMESSIFPVPSEVVIPPAAFLIAEGKMSLWGGDSPRVGFWGIVLAGTIGSYLGSTITYWVARWLGRAVVIRWGKYFFISEKKLALAEHWMHRYEAGGIFFARLLPVIRHLISIPAGIVRMSFGMFSLMTVVGSFLWCVVLAWLGAEAQRVQPDLIQKPEAMVHFIKGQSHWIILGIVVLAALYFLVLKLTAKPEKPSCCAETVE
ncbi:MAG: DedA family protein [Chthoniobacteraceae bacterium]|nr:DedA family protein [Chthoniobacteraceae bacterium]